MSSSEKYSKLNAALAAIRSVYDVPTQAFSVGDHCNTRGQNLGSLTILGFAKASGITDVSQILPMFGEAYDEVLTDPEGDGHKNIRAFIQCGMEGVKFEGDGISLKPELKLLSDAWEDRERFSPSDAPADVRHAVDFVLQQLDDGNMRTAMKLGNTWITNQTVKQEVLLSFRLNGNEVLGQSGVVGFREAMLFYDKVQTKFAHRRDGRLTSWAEKDFFDAGIRVVPPAMVRYGSFLGKSVVLMPSFTNIGAYVGEGTMVDTWATVGSCAQIGKNVHLSGGVGIGGVLEPLQANPTIIGDDCFIGARSEIVEGVIIEDNCAIAMGVFLGQSTKIYDVFADTITYGRIPSGSVVVPGSLPYAGGKCHLSCAVIVKKVDAGTKAKTALNSMLR